MTYVSSSSLSIPLRSSVMQMQASLAQAQTEISSGTYADLGLSLGAKTGTSLSLKSEIDRLTSYQSTNSLASTRLSATSNALTSLLSAAQSMQASLVTASSSGGATTALTTGATNALQSLISTLNTSAGGQYIFGGINSQTSPIADYSDTSTSGSAVNAAFQSAFNTSPSSANASSISGTAMQTFLNGSFASLFNDSNWQSDWSSASSQAIQSDVAPGQTATTSVSANETAFRQIASAYTMLSEFTGSNFSDAARAAVVSTATSLVSSAVQGLTNLSSGVGVTQTTVASADTSMSAQTDVLKTNVGDLDDVDPYTLSTQVTQLQTQLEASYQLTNKLSQLSLVNYLTE